MLIQLFSSILANSAFRIFCHYSPRFQRILVNYSVQGEIEVFRKLLIGLSLLVGDVNRAPSVLVNFASNESSLATTICQN